MRTWDVRCAIKAARAIESLKGRPMRIAASGDAAVWSLYALLYEPPVESVTLAKLPATHMEGPALFNVLRVLDVPTAVALAAGRAPVVVDNEKVAEFAEQVGGRVKDAVRVEVK
jgi:hypothetical protein